MQEETQRINVFLPLEILDKVKAEAKIKGTTVSGLIRMIVMEYFQGKK
jgi:predicted DNA binding CopG/RHH family protein